MATGYEVKVDRPGARRGEELEIPGLGIFKNGSTRVVDPVQAQTYRDLNPSPVVPDDEGNFVGGEQGPTVLQTFEKHDWITVEPVDMEQDEEGTWSKKAKEPKQPKDNPTPTGGDK